LLTAIYNISTTKNEKLKMSNYQAVCETHGLTREQGETLQRMHYLHAFIYGFFGTEKEAELRQLGLITDTRRGRMDCAKVSSKGQEIARKLAIAEIDDLIAS
jgi:hypothetical protein